MPAETKDSYVVRQGSSRRYCIYYNDIDINIVASNRVRWNLAHELGHVILKHHEITGLEKLYRNGLDDNSYKYLEKEANYFAQLILVPHIPLLCFNVNSSKNIKYLCKISGPAANKRYYEFLDWKTHRDLSDTFDKRIYTYYYNFIYKRKCKNCEAGIIQPSKKICPICGSKNTLEWGDGDKMKYPLLETHENGKLKECPVCHNEETNIEGDYCQICGYNIINKCPNDYDCNNKNPLPSNARFCSICGNSSTFYRDNILKAWDYTESSNNHDGFLYISDGIDEELPFN